MSRVPQQRFALVEDQRKSEQLELFDLEVTTNGIKEENSFIRKLCNLRLFH